MPNECTTVLYIYCTVCCQQDFRNRVELSLQIKKLFQHKIVSEPQNDLASY